MKLSLLTAAFLAGSVLCELTKEKIERADKSNAGKMLVSLFGGRNSERNLKVFLAANKEEKELKKVLSKVSASEARAMKLDKHKRGSYPRGFLRFALCLPSDALKAVNVERVIEWLGAYQHPLESSENMPLDFFKKDDFIQALYWQHYTSHGDSNGFFTALSAEQFGKVMSNFPVFHLDNKQESTMTGASLNALADEHGKKEKLKSYIGKVSPKFLDSINKDKKKRVALSKGVVKLLPKDFLNEIKVANDPSEGKHYTEEHLRAFKKCKGEKLDFSQVPPKMMEKMSEEGAKQAAMKGGLTVEQRSKLKAEQWNAILAKTDGCKTLTEGVKLEHIDQIQFTPKCFGKIDPDRQAYILTHHGALEDDILAYATQEMVDKWASKGETGLDILKHCKNKRVLGHLGAEVRDSENPLKGKTPSKLLKKLKDQLDSLTDEQLSLMKIPKAASLAELRKEAQFVCYREEIVAEMDKLCPLQGKANKTKRKAQRRKETKSAGGRDPAAHIWKDLTAQDIEKLTSPAYSKFSAGMTQALFEEISDEALRGWASNGVVALPFFGELTPEALVLFGDEAFARVGAAQAKSGKFKLAEIRKEQLPHVSVELLVEQSFFTTVSAAELTALGKDRLVSLSGKQWRAMKPEVFASILNKDLLPAIPADATREWTSAQLAALPSDSFGKLTAAQVTVVGMDADEAVLQVLEKRKAELSSEARAAMALRPVQVNAQINGAAGHSLPALATAATVLALSFFLL